MIGSKKLLSVVFGVILVGLLFSSIALAAQGNLWTSAGGNWQNTRYQAAEHTINVSNVGSLEPKWVLETGGDVSATPAVDVANVYFPDWVGNLYAVNKTTGEV